MFRIDDEVVTTNCKWGIVVEVIDEDTAIVLDEDGKQIEVNSDQVLLLK